jgi:hypothetical protein
MINPRTMFMSVAMLALGAMTVAAQSGDGKRYGARDPQTCASKKDPVNGPPTAAQFRKYFICDNEFVQHAGAIGDFLYLVTDVTLEVGKGRPFNHLTDSFQNVDPSQTVYPIRGGYVAWQCTALGQVNGDPGKNCSRNDASKVEGTCYKDAFGDWHCHMCCALGSAARRGFPPPAGF